MDIIVSHLSSAVLVAKLVDAGILVLGEAGAHPPFGISHTQLPPDDAGYHALIRINEAVIGNAAEIRDRLPADMVNVAGAPLRAWAGSLPPEVVEALPDWAYRKALDRMGLSLAWDAAITAAVNKAADKSAAIWWDRAVKITTLEDEWKAIVAEMQWGDSSERKLINRAHRIVYPTEEPAIEAVPERVPT
jgi:hypothetical protein